MRIHRKTGRREVCFGKPHKPSLASRLPAFLFILTFGCAGASTNVPAVQSAVDREKQRVVDFAALEARVIERVAASDPRLARRFKVKPTQATLHRIETEGVLAEDGKTALRGSSVDLFAFGARARTLAAAEKELASWKVALPDAATDGAIGRPRLERELLARLILEERARVEEEAALDAAAGDLVSGVVATWSPGETAFAWHETDEWIARRLLEIGASLKTGRPRTMPSDLQPALFDLERLLVPMQFPRGVAAMTSLHEAIDSDERPELMATAQEILVARLRTHLGVTMPPAQLAAVLEKTRAYVASTIAKSPSDETPAARAALDKKARASLFAVTDCPQVVGSIVRGAAPSSEREAICGALQLVERVVAAAQSDRAPALVALHDMLVVASWTITPPPSRARVAALSFRADEEISDTMKHLAAARPLVALAAGYAIALLYATASFEASPNDAVVRARAWMAFGDAPFDVIERELWSRSNAPTSSPPPPASLRP